MNAYRNFTNNSTSINKNLEKLSSGYKINRAGDDAAGLAISEKMRAQITGLEVAQKNAKDGISLVQTAEGALTEVQDMLNRMYSLAEQSANGTYDKNVDRQQLQKEVDSLRTEINRIADSANFNGITLLDGSLSQANASAAGGIDGQVNPDATGFETAVWGGFEFDENLDSALQETIAADLQGGSITVTAGDDGAYSATVLAGDPNNATYTYGIEDFDATASGEVTVSLTATVDGQNVTVGSLTLTLPAYDEEDDDLVEAWDDVNGETAAFRLTAKAGSGSGDSDSGPMTLQVGDTSDDYNQMKVSIDSIKTNMLGKYEVKRDTTEVENDDGTTTKTESPEYKVLVAEASGDATAPTTIADIDISQAGNAQVAMDVIKDAINYVSDTRGGLGALQNRLEHTINNLSVMQENIQDAESTIRDTDVAEEMMKYTKNNILVQSAQAMLAQANQLPQGVLQLLQ